MGRPKLNPRVFRFGIIAARSGQAAGNGGGAVNTMDLNAGDPGNNDDYNQCFITLVTNTGAGQTRRIINQAVRVITVEPNWVTAPDNTTGYVIYQAISNEPFYGTLAAGCTAAQQSVTLMDRESTIDGYYTNLTIEIVGGMGFTNQAGPIRRRIIQYTGGSRTAILESPFGVLTDNTTKYKIDGHLYFPVSHLEMALEDGTLFKVAYTPGQIAFGSGFLTADVVHDHDIGTISYIEFARKAGDVAATMNILRTE